MKRRRTEMHGYILIVALGALILAATVMTTLARAAIDQTRLARQAADSLQQRWGVISCRQAILPHAEQLLAFQEAKDRAPILNYHESIRLGSCVLALTISDEQAKANVNAVLSTADVSTAEDRVRRALSESGLPTSIRLRPAINLSNSTTRASNGVVSGWGQITDGADVRRVIAQSVLLTCWGDGRINLARATAPAIALAAPTLLQNDIDHLIDARTAIFSGNAQQVASGGDPVGQLFHAAQIDPAHTAGLTVGSACHSLWIMTNDGRRFWYDLAVRDDSNPDDPLVRCFSW